MITSVVPRQTPEQEELQAKRAILAELESQLADLELELVNLQSELAAFNARYIRIVGSKFAELDRLEAEIAERLAHSNPHDEDLKNQSEVARARAAASQRAVENVSTMPAEVGSASDDLKKLYREVAKQIHPDLANDPSERQCREELMARANAADGRRDEQALRDILDEWQNSPESVQGRGVEAELVRIIRKIALARKRITCGPQKPCRISNLRKMSGLLLHLSQAVGYHGPAYRCYSGLEGNAGE